MTLYKHEMRMGRKMLVLWTAIIAFMAALCIFLYVDMKEEMGAFSAIIQNMSWMTAAFGMDKLDFTTIMGFYGIECGSLIGIGGGFFAAMLGASALAKEEGGRTAEFLLTHPISRLHVMAQKYLACLTELLLLNIAVSIISYLAALAIGNPLSIKPFLTLHLAYFLMQVQLMSLCFGLSAFMSRGGAGLGIGIAALLYFLSLIINIGKDLSSLRYITPYAYCDAADILTSGAINGTLLLAGQLIGLAFLLSGVLNYARKDIAS